MNGPARLITTPIFASCAREEMAWSRRASTILEADTSPMPGTRNRSSYAARFTSTGNSQGCRRAMTSLGSFARESCPPSPRARSSSGGEKPYTRSSQSAW